jgi:hypothetical protein
MIAQRLPAAADDHAMPNDAGGAGEHGNGKNDLGQRIGVACNTTVDGKEAAGGDGRHRQAEGVK